MEETVPCFEQKHCDVLHVFFGGVIVGEHLEKEEGRVPTKLTLWYLNSKTFHEVIVNFRVTEIASMHIHCLIWGTTEEEDQRLAVFKLTEPEIIHRIYEINTGLYRIRQHETLPVKSRKGNGTVHLSPILVEGKRNKRIAATETDAFLVSNDTKWVIWLLSDRDYLNRTLRREDYVHQNDIVDDRHKALHFYSFMENIDEQDWVCQIAAGGAHVVILTAGGIVFTLGSNTMGQLGFTGRMNAESFTCVEALAGKLIMKVECGTWHTLAFTQTKEIYVWGRNNHGQLGLDLDDEFQTTPVLMDFSGEKLPENVRGAFEPFDIWAHRYSSIVIMTPLPVAAEVVETLSIEQLRIRCDRYFYCVGQRSQDGEQIYVEE